MTTQRLAPSLILGLALALTSACDGDDGDDSANSDTETGDGDGDPGDGDGEPVLMGCGAIMDSQGCLDEPGCAPVFGNELVDDGDGGYCTSAEEGFVGCANASELCPMLGKTLCDGDTIWRTTSCVPDNVTPCEAPGEISGPCE